MRRFKTGATRSDINDKPDYEGCLSPQVIRAFGAFMQHHSICEDGSRRASDNWQLGIPQDEYMKSAFRHFMDLWEQHRGARDAEKLIEAACATMFNIMGFIHEVICDSKA